ncbi:hypothetical protein VTN31DRAFT_3909 [Thermomyces dupontii]|uniref:uncharacterized protein n=1 Tax=Talaromyces thermophilus TaxID=28565 RepID=UPI0037432662
MVLLKSTPTILAALERIPSSTREDLGLPTVSVGAPISHDDLIALARYYRNTAEADGERNPYTLDTLLRGTSVYVPPPPPKPEPTPEYLERKKYLQSLLDEQAYKRLLSPSSAPEQPNIFSSLEDIAEDSPDPITPSVVINILLSVVLCAFAIFWALRHYQTPSFLQLSSPLPSKDRQLPAVGTSAINNKDPVFVLISLFVGLLVGVAEVVVYASYLRKMRTAKEKESRFKEIKQVIPEDHTADDSKDIKDVSHREEIWGRGINGGVRRRIRERWRDQ